MSGPRFIQRYEVLLSVILLAVIMTACARTPEQKGAKFLNNGKSLMENKDYVRATLELKNAIRLMPQNAEAYYQLGLCYLATGDSRLGTSAFRRAAALDPKHIGAQLKLAELQMGSSDPEVLEDAHKRIESIFSIDPDDPKVIDALAVSEFRLGKTESATDRLEAAISRFPKDLAAPQNLAAFKLGQKDFAGAEQVLKQAALRAPSSPEAQTALGHLYVILQRPRDAEAAFRRAAEIDPKNGPALLDLATMQFATGQKDAADSTFAALSSLPDKAYRPLHAEFLITEGKYDAAVKELEPQAAAAPDDRAARSRQILAYVLANRVPDAERVINAALKKNPKDADSLMDRGRLYLASGRYAEAQKDLVQVLRSEPNSANVHFLLSKLHRARGSEALRRQELSEATRLNPRLLPARIELAESLINARSANNALALLDKAPDDQRENPALLIERNWVLFALGGRQAELRKSIDQSLAKQKSADVLFQDGILRFQQKDFAGGRKSLEQALALKADDTRTVDALARSYAVEKQSSAALQVVQRYASRKPNSPAFQ
jgi:tetratricopeptide (TPR) repeat protein